MASRVNESVIQSGPPLWDKVIAESVILLAIGFSEQHIISYK